MEKQGRVWVVWVEKGVETDSKVGFFDPNLAEIINPKRLLIGKITEIIGWRHGAFTKDAPRYLYLGNTYTVGSNACALFSTTSLLAFMGYLRETPSPSRLRTICCDI
jgi:hypothetical protein